MQSVLENCNVVVKTPFSVVNFKPYREQTLYFLLRDRQACISKYKLQGFIVCKKNVCGQATRIFSSHVLASKEQVRLL